MAQRSILILGAGYMQQPALVAARSLGLKAILADGNPRALLAQEADVFTEIDLKDKAALLDFARPYYEAGELAAVFTAGTDFSASVAWVTSALGLPGHSYEAACNASNKSLMRKIFLENNIPSPKFITITQASQKIDTSHLEYPLVVKPVDNMGARGVSKVANEAGLSSALELARQYSRSGDVIIEEFIVGPEFSIDSLVFNKQIIPRGLASRHIFFPPYFVELGHTLPSHLSKTESDNLIEVFSKAVRSLGLTHGVAKGDVFYTEKGPVIGEIAARLSGGYMSGWTYPLASGIDLTREAMLLALGEPLDAIKELRQWTSTERALVSIPGTVKQVRGVNEAQKLPGLDRVVLRCEPDMEVCFPSNNVEKAGNIIVSRPERVSAISTAEAAVGLIRIELVPNNTITEEWLRLPGRRPEHMGNETNTAFAYPDLGEQVKLLQSDEWQVIGKAIQNKQALPLDGRSISHLNMQEKSVWEYRKLEELVSLLIKEEKICLDTQGFGRVFWWIAAKGGLQALQYFLETVHTEGYTYIDKWKNWAGEWLE